MKKITTLFIVFVLASQMGFSQYFTVKLGGGYAVPGIQQSTGVLTFQPGSSTDPAYASIIPLMSYNTTSHDSLKNRYKSNVYDGYGHGGHFDFSFGYMINPYFGVQIDGAFLWGSTVTARQTFDDAGVLGPNTTIVTKTHSTGLSLNPSLCFRAAKPTAKVAPYARVGLALPVFGAIYHTLDIDAPNSLLAANGAKAHIDVKTESTLSLGFQGSVGVAYTPVPLITIWGELNGQYLFVKAKQSTLTAYDLALNGGAPASLLQGLSTYSKVTNFVDKLDANSNSEDFKTRNSTKSGQPGYVDETKGHDELRQVANLGSFGFSVGVTFNMSKKIFKDPFGKKAKAEAANKK